MKYRIYAYEELKNIYKARHDLIGVGQTASVLDSLNKAYDQAQHIADLHNQHEQLEQQKHEGQLAIRQRWLLYALTGGSLLLLLTVGLFGTLRLQRARRLRLEGELERMRAELTALLTAPPAPLAKTPSDITRQFTSPRPQQPDLSVLSERQHDVLNGILAGLSNRDIADKLCISENTVKYHLKNIYMLLDVENRVELLANLRA